MKTYLRFWKEMISQVFQGGKLYWTWVLVLAGVFACGAFAYVRQLQEGLIVSNLSDQVSWGAYIANFTYIVGIAASAILLMIPAYFYRIEEVKKITIIGELLAVSAVTMAMLFVTVDLGRPDRFWHLIPFLGRVNWPVSILSWDVVLLSGYLVLALHIPGYLLYKKYMGQKPKAIFYKPFIYFSIFWAAIPVTAFLYSGMGGRPFWNSAVIAPRFLMSSFIAGPSFLLLTLYIVEWKQLFEVPRMVMKVLIRIVALALIINLFLLASECFKEFYTGALESASAQYLFFGWKGKKMLVPYTWTSLVLIVLATFIFASQTLSRNNRLIQIGAVFAIIGTWIEKGMGMVIPGFVPSPLGDVIEYTPSWYEIRVCAGIWAFGFLIFTLFLKAALPIERGEISLKKNHLSSEDEISKAGFSIGRGVASVVFVMLLVVGLGRSVSAAENKLVSGWWMEDFRWRTTGGYTDMSTSTTATLNVGDPTLQRFSGSIQGGVIADFNKQAPSSPFHNVFDTFGTHAIGRFYFGYLDMNRLGVFSNIRVGRQHLYEMEGLYFDGASIETKAYAGLVLSAFGGVPVHQYENQIGFDPGDWTAGGAIQWTPISKLRLRLSAVQLKDKASGFRIYKGNLDDALLGAAVWFNALPSWELYARLTSFTDQIRDLDFASTAQIAKYDIKLTLTARRLFEKYDFRVNELDPYSFAGSYKPYTEVMAQVYKGIGNKFSLTVGGGKRFLDHGEVANEFNHGFDKIYGSFATHDFLLKGLSSTLTADYYHGRDNIFKNNYFGLSFSLNQDLFKKKLRLGAGTAYYLYRFNQYTGTESSDVRTYFAEVEDRIVKNLKLKATYEFEQNRINDFHSGKVRLVWDL